MKTYIFVNSVEMYECRVKDSEINAAPLWLDNVSEKDSVDNMKRTGLYKYVYDDSQLIMIILILIILKNTWWNKTTSVYILREVK